jgi:hypothetical protein
VVLPSVTVYVMFVEPGATGVTTPVGLTAAAAAFEEAHVYVNGPVPVAFDVSDKVLPIHTEFAPVIAPATGGVLTVIVTAVLDKL